MRNSISKGALWVTLSSRMFTRFLFINFKLPCLAPVFVYFGCGFLASILLFLHLKCFSSFFAFSSGNISHFCLVSPFDWPTSGMERVCVCECWGGAFRQTRLTMFTWRLTFLPSVLMEKIQEGLSTSFYFPVCSWVHVSKSHVKE